MTDRRAIIGCLQQVPHMRKVVKSVVFFADYLD
jgi:hypothetical protein